MFYDFLQICVVKGILDENTIGKCSIFVHHFVLYYMFFVKYNVITCRGKERNLGYIVGPLEAICGFVSPEV